MARYSAAVQRYFAHPPVEMGADAIGEAGSEQRGVRICFGVDVRAGSLRNVGFRAYACPHIIAACQRVVEVLEGAPVEQLQTLSLHELQQQLEIPVEKAGKLLILKDALSACHANLVGRGMC